MNAKHGWLCTVGGKNLPDSRADKNLHLSTHESVATRIKGRLRGQVNELRALLRAPGVDVNADDGVARTPLVCASYNGDLEAVSILLDAPEYEVNRQDEWGRTPLHATISRGHPHPRRS